jgi:DegV family protein with EDD domain
MQTITLNKNKLYHSILAGAKSVLKHKDILNTINVFPVADGDTGTNLASLMQSILSEKQTENTDDQKLLAIADRALEGARGNSGIIFAQYLNGLIYELDISKDEIDVLNLLNAMNKAVTYAYDAVSQPVEGTMITLMRAWSETLTLVSEQTKDMTILFSKSFERLEECLLQTTEQLDVLKKNHVVDAGAKGFYHFVEGLLYFLKDEFMDELYDDQFDEHQKIEGPEIHEPFKEDDFRYCTEALITGENLSAKEIRISLHDLGNSLVVAGNQNKARIHIHTNEPYTVFERLRTFGHIMEQKVDDMKRQYEVKNARKYNTVIVTDSIADLPQTLIDQYQIQQINLTLTIEGSDYYDKLTMTSKTFHKFMDELDTYPTTTQPNLKQMQNLFSYLSTYYKNILVISVSSKMSGTYNVYQQAKKVVNKDTMIEVIDSKQNSGAQGLLVMKAAEMIDNGIAFDKVVTKINELRDQTKILVRVKTLKYMVKGGRVSKVTGVIGDLVNLKPVVSIDSEGKGMIYTKAFSTITATRKIFSHIKDVLREKGIERYTIVYANYDKHTEAFIDKAKQVIGFDPVYTMEISAIVAMNAGIGTVAIAYISK